MATTSAAVSAGGYVSIPESVRDFYSKEVLFQAQPRLRFLQFAKIKEDLTAVRGKSIVFVKYGNLDGGGTIDEDDVLVPQGMSTSEVIIPVKEQANSVQVTEYLLRTSLLDTLGDASKLLANNMAKVLDGQFRTTVLSTTNIVFGGSKASAATLVAADSKMSTSTIKDAVELLSTNNAPKIAGEYYVCFVHPHQARQIRDDANWIEANKYMGRRQLYLGEVGMYEGVVFIETTQMPALSAAQLNTKYGTAHAFGAWEAVMFGENAYAWAIAMPVELRDDGVVELGRKHTLGWYGIWGTGIIEEDNIVRLVTT